MPIIDKKQDWLTESGYENDTHTCIVFKRSFLTCDYEFDLPITTDVVKLIWAYDQNDPISSSGLISKHNHNNRGHRSVHLLNHKFKNNNFNIKDGLIRSWDITSNNFTLPHDSDTTYWCKIVSPSFATKAHVVRVSIEKLSLK